MNGKSKVVALGMAAALTLGSAGMALADGGDFHWKDMGEASWAASAVDELSLEGILQGTGGGEFQPNGDVTLGQALALVARLTGQTAVGGGAVAAGLPAYLQGPVAVALEHGAIDRHQLKDLNETATRAEIVQLLVAELGLQSQAQSTSLSALGAFKDARHLGHAEAEDLALAVHLGLLQGNGGELDAEDHMTRAEMAVLLARLESLLGANATATGNLTFGDLQAISGNSLTVTLPDGTSKTFTLAANAEVFLDNQVASPTALAAGDRVVVGVDSSGQAVFVSARGPSSVTDEAEGTVVAITSSSITIAQPPDEGDNQGQGDQGSAPAGAAGSGSGTGTASVQVGTTYPLAPDTVVTFQGQAVPLTSVAAGDEVHLALDAGGTVVAIDIQRMQETVTGTVVDVSDEGFLLTDSAGTLVRVKVGDNTQVSGTIAVGAQVTVTGWYDEEGLHATTVTVAGASGSASGSGGSSSSGSP